MRLRNMFGVLTASALLIGANSANALVLTLEELQVSVSNVGGEEVVTIDTDGSGDAIVTATRTIADNGADDSFNSIDGLINFSGLVGSVFVSGIFASGDDTTSSTESEIDISFGATSSVDDVEQAGALRISLLEEDVDLGQTQSTLTGFHSEIDFNSVHLRASASTFFNINDATADGIAVGDRQLIDADLNREESLDPDEDVSNTVLATLNPGDVFDLLTVITITHNDAKFAQTTGQAKIEVAGVPLPAALPLFLTALLGLGFVGRHRRRAAA